MSFLKKALVILLLAAVARFVFRTLWRSGAFRIVYNQKPGPCRAIPMNGSEDIALLPDGVAIITSGIRNVGDRYGIALPPCEGKLYAFDLKKTTATAHEIRLVESATFETKNFVPHGISHWIDSQSGDVFLQVVSHPTYGDRIEIFRLSSDRHVATHVKSIGNPLLYSINDVAAVGKESFYYSNDHYFVGGNLRKMEAVLQLPWGNVGVYEKNATRVLDASLAYPNGVTLSPDGRYLYVACSTAGSLLIYSRDASTQTLTFRQMIDVTSCCDNLFVEANGHVWLGCHPRCLKTLVCFRSPSGLCDSHVLLVKLGPESEAKDGPPFPDYSIEQIYYDDGRELKASAVAVHYEGRLLIGSINNNLLYCEARSQGT